jgi:hypothetical protein
MMNALSGETLIKATDGSNQHPLKCGDRRGSLRICLLRKRAALASAATTSRQKRVGKNGKLKAHRRQQAFFVMCWIR